MPSYSGHNQLDARLYRLIDRLLRHLDLLAGEQRDTWWFRDQLAARAGTAQAETVLDRLEEFLIDADAHLADSRDSELRALAYTQIQCEELIDQSGWLLREVAAVRDLLVEQVCAEAPELEDEENEGTTASDPNELSPDARLDTVARDLHRVEDRLRLIERKVNELRSGVRNRIDIGFKDAVTGVYKEEGFAVRAAELFARWQRARSPLAVVVVQLSGRDRSDFSPLSLDELMRACARELESRIRVSDLLARTSETEFVLLLPDTNIDGASSFTSRTVVALEMDGFEQYGIKLSIAVAAGLTVAKEGDTVEAFVERSRSACASAIAQRHSMQVVL